MVRRSTWIVLGIFIIFVAAALLLQKYPILQPSSTPTATEYPLLLQGWLPDDLTMVVIKNDKGVTITLQRNPDKTWAFVGIPGVLPDQGKVTQLIDTLTSTNIMASFDASNSLSNVGLSAPTYMITLQNSKGEKKSIRVGNASTIGSGYYVQVDNNTPVLVSKDNLDQVTALTSVDALRLMTPTPTSVETTPNPNATDTSEPATPSNTETPESTSTPGPSPTPVTLSTPVIQVTLTP